ncbi:MAG: serine protease [Roseobacter sp.]
MTLVIVVFGWVMPAAAQDQSSRLKGLAGENDALVWQAVGRLDAQGRGFCTATLITPELVLTAAHCVYRRGTTQMLALDALTFRAGLRNGSVAAERKVAQIEAHPGFNPATPLDASNVKHDVALLRLTQPIPTSALDPFILHDRGLQRGPVSVVSYGQGREDLPSRQPVCNVLGARDEVLFMDCDVTFGSSGAPVFTHRNGRGQIVSLISGAGQYEGQRITYEMQLPQRVAELKQQMRANRRGPIANARRISVGDTTQKGGAKFVRPGGS